jgi:hypothetical protein
MTSSLTLLYGVISSMLCVVWKYPTRFLTMFYEILTSSILGKHCYDWIIDVIFDL